MIGQLRKFWIPPQADTRSAGISLQQRNAGRLAQACNSPEWQHFLACITPEIHQHFSQADPCDTNFFHDLHKIAGRAFVRCFPTERRSVEQTPIDATRSIILDKWRHRDCFRTLALPTVRNVLQAWFHLTRFTVLRRSHKKHAFKARQHRFETIMQQAQTASQNHDSYLLFQVINRFAPKLTKRRLQLRNVSGNLATPMEEQAILHAFVERTWRGPDTVPKPPYVLPGLPFSEGDLMRALQKIPISKAVARPFTPGLIWHSLAPMIAPLLYETLLQIWSRPCPTVPDCWRDAWLLLIPKALKQPSAPEALRPLALQEPLGKAVVGLLAAKAQSASLAQLAPWPIWAYIPNRSTQQALLRVASHCAAGRQLVASQRPTVFHRHQNMPTYKICGAIQLLLDLSKAFDSVCRQELFGRLGEILDDPRIISMLAQWHEHTSYHVETSQGTTPIRVGAGVRQGCKAAPWLFNAFVLLYLRDLAHLIDWTWLQAHLNVFADDFHVSGLFHDLAELHRLLFYFGLIMEVLQEKGFKINTTKSAILLTMGGTNFRPVRSSLTFHDYAGEWIKINGRYTEFILPVVKQAKYLGTLVSYAQFELATMKFRLGLARTAYARLKKWLTARRGLGARERLRLWSTCVLPILTYGIFTIGLTKAGLDQMQTAMMQMFRQIMHDHASNTGHSNQQFLHLHGIDPPLQWLWRAADALLQSVTKQPLHPLTDDICASLDWTPLRQTVEFLHAEIASGLTVPGNHMTQNEASLDHQHVCPHCAFSTAHMAVLRRHLTTAHGITRFRRYIPLVSQYMNNGLPQCSMCHTAFTTWRSFTIHVQRGCQADDVERRQTRPLVPFPDDANGAPLQSLPGANLKLTKEEIESIHNREFGPRLMTLIHQRKWPELLRERAGCTFLSRSCILCGQFVGRAQAMHHHVRVAHRAFSSLVQTKAVQLTNLHSDESPCSACGVTFLSTHSCNVWFQVALLIVHGPKPTICMPDPGADSLQCEICGQGCTTSQELHLHLQREHRLVSSVWHESRDSLDGQPVCNHCNMLFLTMQGLRSHINQGRCLEFNPDLSTAPSEVLPIWREACCSGKLEEVLRDPHNRLRLTLQCQCCPKRYARSTDLAAHLQGAHPQIWAAAQPLTHQLLQRYYGNMGCVCNPSCNVARLQHVCMPFLQLAMQFTRLNEEIFMPTALTPTELARIIPNNVPMDLRHSLEQALLRYDLGSLWPDALLMDALSGTCFLCGHELLQADLYYHLHEAHHGLHAVVKSYVLQLLPHALKHSDSDCACFACGQIFNSPATQLDETQRAARAQLVQAHLRAQCPSVLQLAVLLTHLHHGPTRLSHGSGGGHAANASDLPAPGSASARGQRIDAGTQPSCSQEATKAPGRRAKRPRLGKGAVSGSNLGPQPDSADDGQTSTPGRSGPPGTTARDNLHLLFQLQRSQGDSTSPVAEGGSVAYPSQGGIIILDGPSPTGPLADGDVRIDYPGQQTAGSTGGLSTATGSQTNAAAPGEQDDSLHGLESAGPEASGLDQDPGEPCQDERALHRASRRVSRCEPHHEVSCTTHQGGQSSHTLETPDVSQGGSDLRIAPAPGAIPGMDSSCSQPQATQLAPEHLGQHTGTQLGASTAEGEGQRQAQGQATEVAVPKEGDLSATQPQLTEIVSKLVFANPTNWCFSNAAAYSLFWTLLTLRDFSLMLWGSQRHEITNFLLGAPNQVCNLAAQSFFRDVMRSWGREDLEHLNFSISQQDASEFVSVWLDILQTPAFQMQWEKRLSVAADMRVLDCSHERYMPICLKFDDTLALSSFCTLNTLISLWHQVDGMATALLTASECLCVHLDRCTLGEDLTVCKCTSKLQIDEECFFPVFNGTSAQCDFHGYMVVAIMAHLGTDCAGHYRSALKVSPLIVNQVHPISWLVTDDWRAPTTTWSLPDWMLENTTLVWLVRSDLVRLPYYRTLQDQATSSMAELLRMITEPDVKHKA